MEISGKIILIISPESWGKNFVSKHHYANYLAKENKVYFLNTASNWSIKNICKLEIVKNEVNKNLTTISYSNYLPKLNLLPKFIQNFIFQKTAIKIQKKITKEFDIVWSFDPFRFWSFAGWKTKMKIYHTVDIHPKAKFENTIAKNANFIFSISESLLVPFKNINNNCFRIRHGADLFNFKLNNNLNIELPGKQKIKAGLVGNINRNLDFKLIKEIVQTCRNLDFILVGPISSNNLSPQDSETAKKIEALKSEPNLFFIGSVPSANIVSYLNKFDINLVLYKEENRGVNFNPHKMMGYFYAGKITVACWILEYENANKNLLTMCQKNQDIPKTIEFVSKNLDEFNSPENMQFRRSFAEDNSYENQINRIGKIIYH